MCTSSKSAVISSSSPNISGRELVSNAWEIFGDSQVSNISTHHLIVSTSHIVFHVIFTRVNPENPRARQLIDYTNKHNRVYTSGVGKLYGVALLRFTESLRRVRNLGTLFVRKHCGYVRQPCHLRWQRLSLSAPLRAPPPAISLFFHTLITMRLLHFNQDGKLISTDFSGKAAIPPYAILSHRWGDSEVLFADIANGGYKKKKGGYQKIEFCAKQATEDQLQYFWIDTCCIDKWNINELSRLINSMFNWYENAKKCYVFLLDVSVPTTAAVTQQSDWEASFWKSEWFCWGWTL
ncbi:unnamed protein product [Periconia digitata]|uniref:Heterokaryon incompatibility domain-containing protein n=1 Tax=Periconia digitata TaxID=1303443 RepID=A0A9W4XW46_9PLEO|nr:unnamed protein product [Periconia digitata]